MGAGAVVVLYSSYRGKTIFRAKHVSSLDADSCLLASVLYTLDVFTLYIKNLDLAGRRLFLCCEICWCIVYGPLNFIWVHISDFSCP